MLGVCDGGGDDVDDGVDGVGDGVDGVGVGDGGDVRCCLEYPSISSLKVGIMARLVQAGSRREAGRWEAEEALTSPFGLRGCSVCNATPRGIFLHILGVTVVNTRLLLLLL